MRKQSIYQAGGTVRDDRVYIRRKADDELLELCRGAEFGHVLTARQLGKSSLIERTSRQLNLENIRAVTIDLTAIGASKGNVTAQEWYCGLLEEIERQLGLKTNVYHWWEERSRLGKPQRLIRFFEEVLLREISAPVVIFFDEIDSTLSMKFTDDFFTAIRYVYNARAHTPDLKRLSIVFVGGADPSDLIHDPKLTPFNVGTRVDLTDFTLEEASPLAAGLGLPEQEARQVLSWVMKWTNGHPYLTQKVCKALAEQDRGSWTQDEVGAAVGDIFFVSEMSDHNLKFVEKQLTKQKISRRYRAKVLSTYKTIRIGGETVFDEEQSFIKNRLKLSGVVRREKLLGETRKRSGELRKTIGAKVALELRNPIYAEVFDEAWINEHMPVNWFARARRAGLFAVAVLLLFTVGFGLGTRRYLSEKNRVTERNVKASLMAGDVNSIDYIQYQKHVRPDGTVEAPARTQKLADSPELGEITVGFYNSDGALLVTRTGPVPNRQPFYTWVPAPPAEVEPAPGKLNNTDTPASGDKTSSAEPFNSPQIVLASFTAPASLPEAPAGQCLNPHPGAFRSWYGAQNGCWVAVYREWPDGCQHYQWYNSCNGIWDNYPNGAPKVYWVKCVH